MSFDIASATLKRITNCEIGVQREFVWRIWFTYWYFSLIYTTYLAYYIIMRPTVQTSYSDCTLLTYSEHYVITFSTYNTDSLVPSIPVHTDSVDIGLSVDQSQRHNVLALYSRLCSGMSFHLYTNKIHLQ